MHWLFYLSAVMVVLGACAILFAPPVSKDPQRWTGKLGTLILGAGLLTFLLGLVMSKIQ